MAESDASAEKRRQHFASRGASSSPIEADEPPLTPPPGSPPSPSARIPSRPSHNATSPKPSTVTSPKPSTATNASYKEKRRISQRPFSERRRTSVIVGQRSIDFMAETHPEEKGPRFVTFIIKQYKRWGYFIAEHDWQAILICILISVLAVAKVVTTP